MPQSFTPAPPPFLDERGSMLAYIERNMQALKNLLNKTPYESIGTSPPSTGYAGQTFYNTSLKRLYVYTGTAWVCPYPLGEIGRATLAANSSSFIGIIYPLIVSGVVVEAGRKIRVSVHTNPASTTAGASVSVSVCDDAGTIANQAYRICQTANAAEQISVEHTWSGLAAGTYSFRVGAYANVSSYLAAGGTALTIIRVDDIGPV